MPTSKSSRSRHQLLGCRPTRAVSDSVSLVGTYRGVHVCVVRLPRGSSVFPLVVGGLLDLRSIVAHDENLTVRLRGCVGIKRLVFEPHPAAREHNPFAVGRPS